MENSPCPRLLLTWSDRGVAPGALAWHLPRPLEARGPVLRLVEQPDIGPYDGALVVCDPDAAGPAEELVRDLRDWIPHVRLAVLPIDDPSDHGQLFTAFSALIATLPRRADLDVVLSAGTPQVQTLWVILGAAGLLDRDGRARLLQVIPAAFVPARHPRPWREVRLDIEGFPEIRALRTVLLRLRAAARVDPAGLIGDSAPMAALKRQIGRVAPSDIPVLIQGETGTGKELVARALHASGGRASGPFVAESCAALAEGTLASELFGHERGAFTGASGRHRGLFELASGGTLFLDEVGELPPRVQAMLLRALQEGTVRRVGGEHAVRVDVRVVTATHRDLGQMVAYGTFREDLYYRLRGATLAVPPLRARPSDLPALVGRFLAEARRDELRLDPACWDALGAWRWPGNVRELRAEVLRWTVYCDARVGWADLSPEIRGEVLPPPGAAPRQTLAEAVAETERRCILAVLEETGHNLSETARRLDIDRGTLKGRLRRMGLLAERGP